MFSVLGNLASGKEAIDMERMQSVIHRRVLEALNHMEDRPHDTFAFICIGDFLYGNNEQEVNNVFRKEMIICFFKGLMLLSY